MGERNNQKGSAAASVEVVRNHGGNELRIVVRGQLDFGVVFCFRSAYEDTPPVARYVVDLTEANAMSGSALGMLLNLRAFAERAGAMVAVTGISDDFRMLLGLSRLTQAFEYECAA